MTAGVASRVLEARAIAPEALERVDLIRTGTIARTFEGAGSRALSLSETLDDLQSGEYHYLRVIQVDGGTAWSSPFFVD